jgi:hypothetical protein
MPAVMPGEEISQVLTDGLEGRPVMIRRARDRRSRVPRSTTGSSSGTPIGLLRSQPRLGSCATARCRIGLYASSAPRPRTAFRSQRTGTPAAPRDQKRGFQHDLAGGLCQGLV